MTCPPVSGFTTVEAQYAFDPYGIKTVISETVPSDFQYAGYYSHARSGLNLTRTRAYNAGVGRWLNRDTIGESGGNNLYGYVANNPINFNDPTGELIGGGANFCSQDPKQPRDPSPALPAIPDDDDPPDPAPPKQKRPAQYSGSGSPAGGGGGDPTRKRRKQDEYRYPEKPEKMEPDLQRAYEQSKNTNDYAKESNRIYREQGDYSGLNDKYYPPNPRLPKPFDYP